MKTILKAIFLAIFISCCSVPSVKAADKQIQVTFTNLTTGITLTPPLFATSKKKIELLTLAEPASEELEALAEGGDTSGLQELLESEDATVVTHDSAVAPGESITITIDGRKKSFLYVASMLLPTNDGFVAMDGEKIKKNRSFFLTAYDAGTELNDEDCMNIPGPVCGGEGFNEETGEGHISPHPGIHGEGELSRRDYNWGEPVAQVSVEIVK